jgi:hypothetical protein
MTIKKSLENRIRGWFPQEVIIPKVSAVEPLNNFSKARYRAKLTVLSLLLVTSTIPILIFLFFTNYSQRYIYGLLMGESYIVLNAQMGFLEIVSKSVTLIPLKITFLELTIYITSAVVFCLSLTFIAKILYKRKIRRQ